MVSDASVLNRSVISLVHSFRLSLSKYQQHCTKVCGISTVCIAIAMLSQPAHPESEAGLEIEDALGEGDPAYLCILGPQSGVPNREMKAQLQHHTYTRLRALIAVALSPVRSLAKTHDGEGLDSREGGSGCGIQ